MEYADAKAYLDALGIDAMKSLRPATHRIDAISEALDHPERVVPAIHVTGTNGKTSTARIATSVLSATGLRVATYTSPHLQSMRERIALQGRPIGEQEFGDVFDHLLPYLELVEKQLGERLSYFEVLTAMFFLWAAEAPVDVIVVEVGLGGRWDATNVVPSRVAVVTNVSYDHTQLLGSDRRRIALEKSGIIKRESVAITAERSPEIVEVIAAEARAAGASLSRIDHEFTVGENRLAFGGRYLSIASAGTYYEGLFLPLHGAHQGVNAAVAVEAVNRFLAGPLDREVIAEGFAATHAPGRLETVRKHDRAPVVLDVAHNPDGMSALVNSLAEAFAFDRVRFVIGILADKDYVGMLSELSRLPCTIIVTRPKTVRAVTVKDLKIAAGEMGLMCEAIDDVSRAVDAAIDASSQGELVCITGSHYVVGEARSHLIGGGDP